MMSAAIFLRLSGTPQNGTQHISPTDDSYRTFALDMARPRGIRLLLRFEPDGTVYVCHVRGRLSQLVRHRVRRTVLPSHR